MSRQLLLVALLLCLPCVFAQPFNLWCRGGVPQSEYNLWQSAEGPWYIGVPFTPATAPYSPYSGLSAGNCAVESGTPATTSLVYEIPESITCYYTQTAISCSSYNSVLSTILDLTQQSYTFEFVAQNVYVGGTFLSYQVTAVYINRPFTK